MGYLVTVFVYQLLLQLGHIRVKRMVDRHNVLGICLVERV